MTGWVDAEALIKNMVPEPGGPLPVFDAPILQWFAELKVHQAACTILANNDFLIQQVSSIFRLATERSKQLYQTTGTNLTDAGSCVLVENLLPCNDRWHTGCWTVISTKTTPEPLQQNGRQLGTEA